MDEARPEENRAFKRFTKHYKVIIQNRDFRRISIMESDARKFCFKSQGKKN